MLKVEPIQNGVVIDHIPAGRGMEIYRLLHLESKHQAVALLRQDATIFSNCLLLGSTAAFTVIRNCRYRGDTIWIFLHTKKAILLCLITIFKYAKLTRIAVW